METRGFGIHRDEGVAAKRRDHLTKGVRASDVAIHKLVFVVWKSAPLAVSCRDSSTGHASFYFTHDLETRSYFFECFGQGAVELWVRGLRRPA